MNSSLGFHNAPASVFEQQKQQLIARARKKKKNLRMRNKTTFDNVSKIPPRLLLSATPQKNTAPHPRPTTFDIRTAVNFKKSNGILGHLNNTHASATPTNTQSQQQATQPRAQNDPELDKRLQTLELKGNAREEAQYAMKVQHTALRQDMGAVLQTLAKLESDKPRASQIQELQDKLAQVSEKLETCQQNVQELTGGRITLKATAAVDVQLFDRADVKGPAQAVVHCGELVLLVYPHTLDADDNIWVNIRRVFDNGTVKEFFVMFYEKTSDTHFFSDFTFST